MILQLRFSNSGFSPAMYPSSVVQTGVKFFGCGEQDGPAIAEPLVEIDPTCVLSAVKLGASLLILNAMTHLHISRAV